MKILGMKLVWKNFVLYSMSFKKKGSLILFCLLNLQFGFCQVLNLIDNGKSFYKIIISQSATDTEIFAGKELQKYLHQISGVKIPILKDNITKQRFEIQVGRTNRNNKVDYAALNKDGILIKTYGQDLILTGGSHKGVLYCIYEFLENYLGCRKFTKDVEHIPKQPKIKISASIYYFKLPSFEYRTTYFVDAFDSSYVNWNKLNFPFEGRIHAVHSLGWYIPANVYFKQHPEYFALVEGKRNPAQPCLSNPDVFRIVKDALQRKMAEYPANQVWSVSHLDNILFCHCNLCEPKHRSGNGFSETLIPFVNKIALAFPNKTISTLAYNQSMMSSKSVSPAKNVEIMFCFTNIDRAILIEEDNRPEAIKQKEALLEWRKQTTNIFVWDYIVNYFHSMAPFPNIQSLKPNFDYFKRLHILKIFSQGIGNQKAELSELKSYIVSKLLWDNSTDVEKQIKEFTDFFYGPAAPDIRSYIKLQQEQVRMHHVSLSVWGSPYDYRNDFLSLENISKYNSILNSAYQKVKNNSNYSKRVIKEILSVCYAELEIYKRNIQTKRIRLSPEIRKKIAFFQENVKSIGIEFVMNGEKTPEEYLQDF